MKKYKFITIERDEEDHNDRPLYRIVNNKDKGLLGLGNIFWYPPWKRYVMNSTTTAVFDSNCLEDVIDFIKNEIPKEKK